MGILSKYEQETVINFNAGEQTAIVYTRDKAVMRRIDALIIVSRENCQKSKGSKRERE